MKTITFDENVLTEVNSDDADFEHEVKQGAALSFYLRHKMTLGQASELCGLTQYEFMRFLDTCGIPALDYPAAELDREVTA